MLYAFDLLETIYLEAYEDPDLGPSLQADYPGLADYKQAIPALILKHNLHGIDIDLRAAQIAALALWLRAQRSYTKLEIAARQRPKALQPQIVCAEPMPGEYDLLGEFLRDLQPAILGNLVREIWERMEDADEIGSLLKVEQEIRSAIEKARKAWLSMPEGVQLSLFGGRPAAVQLKMDLAEIKDESFWEHVEDDVLEALKRYARWASGVEGVTRQLFVHDAAQGFAFVDLLQRPFDVVLMNSAFRRTQPGQQRVHRQELPPHQERSICRLRGKRPGAASVRRDVGRHYQPHGVFPEVFPEVARRDLIARNAGWLRWLIWVMGCWTRPWWRRRRMCWKNSPKINGFMVPYVVP